MFPLLDKFRIRVNNLDSYFLMPKEKRTRKHKYIPFIRWYLIPEALPLDGPNNWDSFHKRIKKDSPVQWFFREKVPSLFNDYIRYPIYGLYWKYEEKIKDSNAELKKSISRKYTNPVEIVEQIAFYYFNKYVLYSYKTESKNNKKLSFGKRKHINRLSNFNDVNSFKEHLKENYVFEGNLIENSNLGDKTPSEYCRHLELQAFLDEMIEAFQWFKFERKQLEDRMELLWKEIEKNKRNFELNSPHFDELNILEEKINQKSLKISFSIFKNHQWM